MAERLGMKSTRRPAGCVEAVNAVHPAWGRPRHREVCPLSCSATSGSFSLPRPMKLPELTQFALQELDVVDRAGAEGDVVQAAVLAVVGERRRREWFAVGGAPPDDPAMLTSLRTSSLVARGFIRRMWDPSGVRSPRGSSV